MSRLIRLLRTANLSRLMIHLLALWKMFRHPNAPPSAKWVALGVLCYVISPVDLVPDLLPMLGLVDDLVAIPLGVTLVSQLAPPSVWQRCLLEAERAKSRWPSARTLGLMLLAWLAVMLGLVIWWVSGW